MRNPPDRRTLSQVLLKPQAPASSAPTTVVADLRRLIHIYETILETTDDFVYIFDPQARFLYANARLLKVWAKTLEEIVGKTCYELGYPEWHADMHTREIQDVVRTKAPIRGEVPYTGASGIYGVYDYIFKPVLDAAGNVEIIIGTTRDVTDRKRDEESLRAAQLELQKRADDLEVKVAERTSSLKDTIGVLESFSYSIVHDMRAPLRSMQGFAEILLTEHLGELSPDARHYLGRIGTSAARMDQLIQDVLTFSRAAREDLHLRPVDAGVLLRDILETYPDLSARQESIQLEGEFPIVLGNEAALTQCFSNLLANALRFAHPGRPVQIRVWAEDLGAQVRLNFEDNGIGIPEALHDRIFELFQRASETGEGTGIGLPIVKKSVERMGGRVGVVSTPDVGSIFWLELNRAEAGEEQA